SIRPWMATRYSSAFTPSTSRPALTATVLIARSLRVRGMPSGSRSSRCSGPSPPGTAWRSWYRNPSCDRIYVGSWTRRRSSYPTNVAARSGLLAHDEPHLSRGTLFFEGRVIDIYGGKDPREVPRYSTAEAAHYLRLPRATLASWVHGRMDANARRMAPVIELPG